MLCFKDLTHAQRFPNNGETLRVRQNLKMRRLGDITSLLGSGYNEYRSHFGSRYHLVACYSQSFLISSSWLPPSLILPYEAQNLSVRILPQRTVIIFFINFICRTKEFVSVANGSEKESIFVSRRSSSAASLSVHRLRLVGWRPAHTVG